MMGRPAGVVVFEGVSIGTIQTVGCPVAARVSASPASSALRLTVNPVEGLQATGVLVLQLLYVSHACSNNFAQSRS